ncbi:MAG: ArnT family glycosyltransferase [Dehalococcoidia bacterium]
MLAAIPFLAAAPFFADPFQHDEAVYAVVARGIPGGAVPYRDLFDHKPPGIYGIFLVAFAVFGEHPWGVRVLGAGAFSASLIATMWTARMLWPASRLPAVAAGVVMAAASGAAILEPTSNTEPFMLAALSWSFALALHSRHADGWRTAFVSGACGAIALLIKPVAAPNLALVLATPGSRTKTASWMAGFAVPFAALGGVMLATGTLAEAVYANLRFNLLYGANGTWPERLTHLEHNSLVVGLCLAPVVAAALLGLLVALGRRQRSDVVVLAWAGLSAIGVAMVGRFYAHYFTQIIPALALLAAAGLVPGGFAVWHHPPRRVIAAGILAASLVTAASMNLSVYTANGSLARAAAKEGPGVLERRSESTEVAAYLHERMRKGDQIILFGRETQLLWELDRPSASRFIFDVPLWIDPANLAEFESDIVSGDALYIVDWVSALAGAETDLNVAAVRRVIASRYDLEAEFGTAKVYRLRQ